MSTAAQSKTDLKQLAAEIVGRAMKAGATDAEAVAYESDEFSVLVRLGQVETLKESSARAIGLRVYNGLRTASTSSSDLTPDGLDRLVEGAVALSKITSEDPFVGLPDESEFSTISPREIERLGLYFEDVTEQPPAERIEIARACEAAAMAYDTRIQNSGGGDFDTSTTHRALANSRGFAAEYRRSYCGFSAAPIAVDERGRMQRNYWYSSERTTRLLEAPEVIGRIAAQRTLRRIGARQVKTQRAPVVFAPEIARSIIGNIFDAANGDAIYRHATFFDGMLGEVVAAANVTVVNDGTMVFPRLAADDVTIEVGGFGTSPFDGEGLPTRRLVLVENGVLKSYVTNTYTARKLGLRSTGSASRSLAGAPGIGASNFYLEPGTLTPEQLLAPIQQGLYVTETMGFGVNLVTGDYSQGASGLWIENGELAYPVEEITIAGNLKEMYRNIVAIANDLNFRSASASPTIHIEGMTIAGS